MTDNDEIAGPELHRRRAFTGERLSKLRELATHPDIMKHQDLGVYVTGSYGRLEACKYSDLDIFFIHDGKEKQSTLSRIDKVMMDYAIVQKARELGIPEFTRGGVYLRINYWDDIVENIGSQTEDYHNFFTARMLLLLEGEHICNEDFVKKKLEALVEVYFKDFHEHETEFRPVFLVNDVIRFWKTMCLNYEHRRSRQGGDGSDRVRAHVKNYKLKFSRLLICFSLMIGILAQDKVDIHGVMNVVKDRPTGRLLKVHDEKKQLRSLVEQVFVLYDDFLRVTSRSSEDVIEMFSDRVVRNEKFDNARRFGDLMFQLLTNSISDGKLARYLVV